MDAPPVRYAKTSDGVSIAYFSLGDGPPIVFASNIYGEAYLYRLRWPAVRNTTDQLVEMGWRVVRHDVRGMGSSDRVIVDIGLEARVRDVEAIIAREGLKRFAIGGGDSGAAVAMAYAERHPEQTSHLVLLSPWAVGARRARLGGTRGLVSVAEDEWESYAWTAASLLTHFDNPELARTLAQAIKGSTSLESYLAFRRACERIDLLPLLPRLTMPALIVHEPTRETGSFELAQQVAACIGDARFVVVRGDSNAGDVAEHVAAIDHFLRSTAGSMDTRPAEKGMLLGGLSVREVEVLRLIAAGRSNPQIADELVISLNTVQRHVSNILDKTGAANRTEAAGYARDKGLL